MRAKREIDLQQRSPSRLATLLTEKIIQRNALHIYTKVRIFMQVLHPKEPKKGESAAKMKAERHNAIRELVSNTSILNQDELRRKLRRRGFAVTQATLSRDMHELHLLKGPEGYTLANGNGAAPVTLDDRPPSVEEVLDSFGLRCEQAMNQIVIRTVMGGAQPVAASLDYEDWADIVGTIAGDDTVLVICPTPQLAGEVMKRLKRMLEG